ncbi:MULTISPECIES: zf-HC2 domain-containing protein [unclassified Streptomyces]|uniref:zf-HC2 domain-containing protein n=1 Tax=unclassified Streptomyces TaxID=2593676 RepID=UPI00336A9D69
MTEGPASLDADTYIRLHQDHHPHLVAYARTLTGAPWPAEDAVAEAYFLVWRRLRSGAAVGDVPAALKATVRDLAMSAASRDRAQRVSYVDLLARVIEDLPQRWVKALWQAEAERQPPVAEAGRRAEAGAGPAAALERARDGMRQHFLRAQPGSPADPACEWCWERLPEHVRGADSPTQAEQVAVHVAGCADCRARVELLMAADARLSALVGPALMVLLSRGTADYLVPLARAGGAVAALSSLPSGGAHAGPAAETLELPARTSEAGPPRHRARRRAPRVGRPVAAVAGAGALALAGAAVAAGLVFTGGDSSGPEQRTAASGHSSESSSGVTSSPEESARPGAAGHGASGDASAHPSTQNSGDAADRSQERSSSSSTPPSSASSAPGTSGAPKSTPASAAPSTKSSGGKTPAKTPTRAPATKPTPTRTQSATPKPTQSQDQTATATPEPTATSTESPAAEPSKSPKPTESAEATKADGRPPASGRSGADGWDNG